MFLGKDGTSSGQGVSHDLIVQPVTFGIERLVASGYFPLRNKPYLELTSKSPLPRTRTISSIQTPLSVGAKVRESRWTGILPMDADRRIPLLLSTASDHARWSFHRPRPGSPFWENSSSYASACEGLGKRNNRALPPRRYILANSPRGLPVEESISGCRALG